MKSRDLFREHALAVALVLSLALLSAQLSVQLRAATMPVAFAGEFGTFKGQPLQPEFQNRILSPMMLVALREIFPATVSDKSVWFALRVLQAVMAYLVLYVVAFRVTGGTLRALAAVALVAFGYAWTPLSHPWEYTSDFFDVLFISLAVGLALAERSVALLAVVIVGSINRESAAFAGIIWIALATVRYGPWPEQWRRFVPGLIYMVVAMLIVLALRHWLSHGQVLASRLGGLIAVREWQWILYPDGAFPLLVCLILAFAALLRALPRPWTLDQKGLGLAALGCAVLSFAIGIAGELRIFLPCIVILSFLAVSGANGRSDKDWIRSLAA